MSKFEKGTFITVPNKDYLQKMTCNEMGVYLWLCAYTDDYGVCFPSRALLAQNTSLTKKTVDKCIKSLILIGVLEKQERYKNNEQTSNLYQINILPSVIKDTGGREMKDTTPGKINTLPQGNERLTELNTINSIQLTKDIKVIKTKYGEFENVLLSDEEYSKLLQSNQHNLGEVIEELSGYMESTGKRYKSHYATLLNWLRRKGSGTKNYKQKSISMI